MPRVPFTGEPQVQSGAIPTGGIQVNTGTGAERVGQAIDQLGGVVQHESNRVAAEALHEARTAALTGAVAQAGQARLNATMQVRQSKGADALAIADTAKPALEKQFQQIEDGIADPKVKQAFQQHRARELLSFDEDLQGHVARETESYKGQQFQAFQETSRSLALDSAGDAQRVDEEVARQRASVQDQYRTAAPEVRDRIAAEAVSQTRAGVVQQLIDADPVRAKAELARVHDEILPEQRVKLNAALEVADRRLASQRMVDEIRQMRGEDGQPLDLTAGLDEIAKRAGDDATLRDAAESRFVQMHQLEKRAAEEREVAAMSQAYGILKDPQNTRGLDAVPPSLMAQMSPERQDALARYAKREIQPIQTDWPTYYNLRQAATNPQTTEAFKQLNLLDYRGKLSDSEFKELTKLQEEIKGQASEQRLLSGLRTRDDIVNEKLAAAGIDPRPYLTSKSGVTPNAQALSFRQQLDRMVVAQQEATGKQASPDDVAAMADRLLITTKVPTRHWYTAGIATDSDVPAFQLPNADKIAYRLADVPAADRAAIQEAAKKRGVSVSDAYIIDQYNRGLGK